MKRPKTTSNDKLELFRFLTYFLVAVMGLLVISEIVLLLYWQWHPDFVKSKSFSETNNNGQNWSYLDPTIYEKEVGLALAEYDPGTPYNLDNYKNLRTDVADLFVPSQYRDFHLQLIILLDNCITRLVEVQTDASREAQQKLDECRHNLSSFVQDNSWLNN